MKNINWQTVINIMAMQLKQEYQLPIKTKMLRDRGHTLLNNVASMRSI
jgi:hypothetical protein